MRKGLCGSCFGVHDIDDDYDDIEADGCCAMPDVCSCDACSDVAKAIEIVRGFGNEALKAAFGDLFHLSVIKHKVVDIGINFDKKEIH